MTNYKFQGTLGAETLTSCSDLLALSQARLITGRSDMASIMRQSEYADTFIPVNVYQMIHGKNGKANLMGAFGSASVRTARKAEKIYGAAGA